VHLQATPLQASPKLSIHLHQFQAYLVPLEIPENPKWGNLMFRTPYINPTNAGFPQRSHVTPGGGGGGNSNFSHPLHQLHGCWTLGSPRDLRGSQGWERLLMFQTPDITSTHAMGDPNVSNPLHNLQGCWVPPIISGDARGGGKNLVPRTPFTNS
jgi:hypothetical protein